MSRRTSLASLLLERLDQEDEKEEGGKRKQSSITVPPMSPFRLAFSLATFADVIFFCLHRVLADEELPGWLGLPWSPKSWPPSSSSQVL